MSLASYIGSNVKIPTSDESSEDLIVIGNCFSDEEMRKDVKEYQFSTPFVYEVSSHWGIEITEHLDAETREDSKKKLTELCRIMDGHLIKDDFFELFSCWVGEEADKREGELTLKINSFDIDQIEIPTKTLVRFEK
ncbi:hypothetical protein M4D55_25390 [Metabacillus idriensis]|uniref:hypothetical protein n=1 Tax=Metabacillus idriensis TaxID=324768 RepID=UPI002041D1E0|nr:hypothetical protein [Metabacillus idriensis]MCM3599074.1 hypothetical protein [Metabacillus idriensis]